MNSYLVIIYALVLFSIIHASEDDELDIEITDEEEVRYVDLVVDYYNENSGSPYRAKLGKVLEAIKEGPNLFSFWLIIVPTHCRKNDPQKLPLDECSPNNSVSGVLLSVDLVFVSLYLKSFHFTSILITLSRFSQILQKWCRYQVRIASGKKIVKKISCKKPGLAEYSKGGKKSSSKRPE